MIIEVSVRTLVKAALVVGGAVVAYKMYKKDRKDRKEATKVREEVTAKFDSEHPDIMGKLTEANPEMTAEERTDARDILCEYRRHAMKSNNLKQFHERWARYTRIVSEFEDASDVTALRVSIGYWKREVERKRAKEAEERQHAHERRMARDERWDNYYNNERVVSAIKGRETSLGQEIAHILTM